MNPAGGQYTSLGDLVKVMQTFLDPTRPESLLPVHSVREWFRAVHPLFDDGTEIGAPWEIVKIRNKWGQVQRLYEKCESPFTVPSIIVGRCADVQEIRKGVSLLGIIPRLL